MNFFRLGKACVDYISCFRRLTDLNVFQNFSTSSRISGLSTAEQCQILLRLKELIHLRRGDFLCEVLEYLESQTNYRNVKLKLKEFWPSEDYYFHTDYQLNLIKKYCPYIENAYFMYKFDCCSNLTQLQCFLCLTGNTIYYVYMDSLLNIIFNEYSLFCLYHETYDFKELDLSGGSFYDNGLCDYFQNHGKGLKKLNLVHVEQLDKSAFALITMCCPNLTDFGISNCETVEGTLQGN